MLVEPPLELTFVWLNPCEITICVVNIALVSPLFVA